MVSLKTQPKPAGYLDMQDSIVAYDLFRDDGLWSMHRDKDNLEHLDALLSDVIDAILGCNAMMSGLCLVASKSRIIYGGYQSSRLLSFEGKISQISSDVSIYTDMDLGLRLRLSTKFLRSIDDKENIPGSIFLSVYDVSTYILVKNSFDILEEGCRDDQDISFFEANRR